MLAAKNPKSTLNNSVRKHKPLRKSF